MASTRCCRSCRWPARRAGGGRWRSARRGAANAALLAIRILARHDPELAGKLRRFAAEETERVLNETLP